MGRQSGLPERIPNAIPHRNSEVLALCTEVILDDLSDQSMARRGHSGTEYRQRSASCNDPQNSRELHYAGKEYLVKN